MASVTAAEVRLLLPQLTGTTEDTDLGTVIDRCEAALARWCGYIEADDGTRSFASATYTEIVDGPGGTRLDLGAAPITSVTTIHDDPELLTYAAAKLVASTDYFVGRSNQREAHQVHLYPSAVHGAWSASRRAVKAVYVAGYSTAPPTLKSALVEYVAWYWQQKRSSPAGVVSIGQRGTNVQRAQPAGIVPPHVQALAAEYVLPHRVVF